MRSTVVSTPPASGPLIRSTVEPTVSTHPRRRPRAARLGFVRPAGYCRERERRRLRPRVQRRAQPGRVGELLQAFALLRRKMRQGRGNHAENR